MRGASRAGLAVPARQSQRQHDVLLDRERVDQVERLEDEADPVAAQLRQLRLRQAGQLGGADDAAVAGDLGLVVTLAAAAAVVVWWRKVRLGMALTLVAAVAAVGYTTLPQGPLWNARLLPFWYLSVYLVAAVGAVEAFLWAGEAWTGKVLVGVGRWRAATQATAGDVCRGGVDTSGDVGRAQSRGAIAVVGGVIAVAVVMFNVAVGLHAVPGGAMRDDGTYEAFGVESTTKNPVAGWAEWNYAGVEAKAKFAEFDALMTTMGGLGRTRGYGRAMWEYSAELGEYGTPMALMMLPFTV